MRDVEISFLKRAGAKAPNPNEIVAFGGVFAGREWQMTPGAIISAITHGVYAFHIIVFDEVVSLCVKKNGTLGTPKDIDQLNLLETLPDGNQEKPNPETVTVTTTKNVANGVKKQTSKKFTK